MTSPAATWKMMPSMRHVFRLCLASMLLIVSSTALAQQMLIVADESISAKGFRPQVGKIATFVCPSDLKLNAEIWGTDVYLDESPICTAAAHAGVLTPGVSGQVTIVMGGEAPSFQGTQRNGVTSLSYGPWSSTYTFIKNGEAGQIDWYTSFDRAPDDFHAPITVLCPPKGNAESGLWGTDVYSASSAICLAAVHAGIITLDAGGRVTVTLQPKQETFVASVRNGILSNFWTGWNYQSYPQPYKVTPGAITVTAPIVPRTITLPGFTASGASTSTGPRTITLAGFTAAGTATPIVPRTLTLSGFSATGTATPIMPRTIPLPGWTSVGTPITP